ncbi:MAG: guanylate kinase, partial [Flavobacteriia bacterium]|nr:guanylate kinase [Flavobacteriia bacterium]
LRGRSTESEEKIRIRLAKAKHELSSASQFDVILVNDQLERACAEAEEIVHQFLVTA